MKDHVSNKKQIEELEEEAGMGMDTVVHVAGGGSVLERIDTRGRLAAAHAASILDTASKA